MQRQQCVERAGEPAGKIDYYFSRKLTPKVQEESHHSSQIKKLSLIKTFSEANNLSRTKNGMPQTSFCFADATEKGIIRQAFEPAAKFSIFN